MIVMKFGGTSIQDTSVCRKVIEIINNTSDPRKVIVFSAMGKTTRKLLALAESYAEQNQTAVEKIFDDIKLFHDTLSQQLISDRTDEKLQSLMDSYFRQIQEVGEEIRKRKTLKPQLQDHMLSFGELLSTAIMTTALQSKGLKATLQDSRDLIRTDSSFTAATPLIRETYEKVKSTLTPVLTKQEIPVIQGFIGSDLQRQVTTLGFEGSDLTASLTGAALGAEEIQIWKVVSGIMTADPCICSQAKSIENITFKEAFELSKAGAKVLHPRTTTPAAEKDIPLRIKNSTRPEDLGTLISNHRLTKDVSIKSIVCNLAKDKAHVSLIGEGISHSRDIIDNVVLQLKRFSCSRKQSESADVVTLIFDKADMQEAISFLHEIVF